MSSKVSPKFSEYIDALSSAPPNPWPEWAPDGIEPPISRPVWLGLVLSVSSVALGVLMSV